MMQTINAVMTAIAVALKPFIIIIVVVVVVVVMVC